jgi:hypothetical protein
MITVRVSTEDPAFDLAKLTPGGTGMWGDCQFVINEPVEQADCWFVIDGLTEPQTTHVPPDNVVLFTTEPYSVRHYQRAFLNQFAQVVTCQRQIRHRHVVHGPPPLPWLISKALDDLKQPDLPKTHDLTMISSRKRMTEGHRLRLRFAQHLQAHFGDAIQIYGRGLRDFDDKWDVQAPARYAVVVENCRSIDYFTEKISDCFLTETFPLYYGCPNIDDFFEPTAFEVIDLQSFATATARIEQVMADDRRYEQRREALRRAKQTYLEKYSLFALLSRHARPASAKHEAVTLKPFPPDFTWHGVRGYLAQKLL